MPSGPIIHVVKSGRKHHGQQFDPEKLQKSLVAACLEAGVPVGNAETTARKVSEQVMIWLENRPEVTSSDIRRVASKHLRTYHPDAGYLYEHHRSTL